MDPQLSELFILKKILTESMTLRRFRLRLNIPLLCQFDASPLWKSTMHFQQVSPEGMLISFKGKHNLNKLLAFNTLQIKAPLRQVLGTSHLKFRECFQHLGQMAFSLDCEESLMCYKINVDRLKKYNDFEIDRLRDKKEFHFFVRFKDFEVSEYDTENNLEQAFTNLTKMTENNFEKVLIKESA
jgi:hypothetical protein